MSPVDVLRCPLEPQTPQVVIKKSEKKEKICFGISRSPSEELRARGGILRSNPPPGRAATRKWATSDPNHKQKNLLPPERRQGIDGFKFQGVGRIF